MAFMEFATGFILAAIAGAAAYKMLNRQYQRKLNNLINEISNWQTIKLPAKQRKDDNAEHLDQAVLELIEITRDLAGEFNLSSLQVRAAFNQVENSIHSVSDISKAFNHLQQLAAALQQSSAALEDDFLASQKSVGEINAAIYSVNDSVSAITRRNKHLKQHIDTMEAAVNQVRSIANKIGTISGQTKMLALNAAIEAARAGEHGRGFSVVADEIGRLSGYTTEAVQQASDVLSEMETKVGEVVESITESLNSTAFAEGQLQNTKEILNSGIKLIEKVNSSAGSSMTSTNQTIQETAAVLELRYHDLQSIKATGKLMAELSDSLEKISDKHRISYVLDQEVTSRVNVIKDLLVDVSKHVDMITLSPGEHEKKLSALKAGNLDIEAIWSNNDQGAFIYSLPPAGLANAGVREWWRKAMSGQCFISPVYISAITRKPCITVSVPIFTGQKVNGVLGVDIKL